MNIARRIAALKREIRYRETEIERIAALRSAKEPTITGLPEHVDKYLADIRAGIELRVSEICELEQRER